LAKRKKKTKPTSTKKTTSAGKLKVGILTAPDEDKYFSNGLHQNAYNLVTLFNKSEILEPVLLYPEVMFGGESKVRKIWGQKVYPLGQKGIEMNVILEVSFGIDDAMRIALHEAGVKMVKIDYGNKLVCELEDFAFSTFVDNRPGGGFLFGGLENPDLPKPAGSWLSPHYSFQKEYVAWRHNVPEGKICPYVWSPYIMKKSMGKDISSKYFKRGDKKNKKIIVLEPNVNITKTAIIPLVICEILYRKNPELYEAAYMFGASKHNSKSPMTTYLMSHESVTGGKVTCEHRYKLPFILDQGHLMLHHNLYNGLNYTLLEACYFNLPVVHNSEYMSTMGYFYEGVNVFDGAAQLELALNHEELSDAEIERYNEACKENIWAWSVENPVNLKGYEDLIMECMDKNDQ